MISSPEVSDLPAQANASETSAHMMTENVRQQACLYQAIAFVWHRSVLSFPITMANIKIA